MLSVRSLVVLMVAALGLFIAGCGGSGTPAPSSGSSSSGGTRTINITATDFKYNPADLTFKAGEKVKLNLTDKGAVDHTWVLTDSSGKELVKIEAKVGQTASQEFTAPTTPGTYPIVCDIPGHKEAGMTGKATVQ